MALVTVQRSPSVQHSPQNQDEPDNAGDNVDGKDGSGSSKSLSECYFANKGAALVLPATERPSGGSGAGARSCCSPVPPPEPVPTQTHPTQPDIQHHLQSMFYLLRPEETLKMAVKLESVHAGRTRYLVVVCRGEEAVLLGIDCNERTSVGLVLRVFADTSIKLDGDGGFSVCICGRQHIFKPVSVQAMWSALQTLHRASARARAHNHFAGGASHAWAAYYEERVDSDRSCLNEWHAMDSIESRRPPSPDSLRHKPREREETERVIRCTLKEIMMSVDLDEVTSKVIRGRLEDELDMDLGEFKSFIDQEMLTILGQMDAPTEVFEHVYLGSEWNASNLEELQRNGVRHILNVTREIDNFFPGMFDYLNVRVYDDEKTDLLKHWDNTFKYITKARNEGSKVLVHCKMGVSRSASVVIAYAMKAYNWNFERALKHVKGKRSCIKPNNNFLNQLETYQGMLDAMKNREKLQRSKSETNLKSPGMVSKTESKITEPNPLMQTLSGSCGGRPRSWSPDTKLTSELLPPTSVSLENLQAETRHMLMPYGNGSYSVSPNQIMRLREEPLTSVKHIVSEIESAAAGDRNKLNRRSLRLNFNTDANLETAKTKLSPAKSSNNKSAAPMVNQKDRNNTWDPGEKDKYEENRLANENDIVKCDSGIIDLQVKSRMSAEIAGVAKDQVMVGGEDVCSGSGVGPPSRQSSWSSVDSAVVPDLSRHSSWGSYDTRTLKVPLPIAKKTKHDATAKLDDTIEKTNSDSCLPHKVNSDLSIISESTESRRSAKVRDYSDNERKFNETCAILKELARAAAAAAGGRRCSRTERGSTWNGRLGASAPCESWLRRVARPRHASHGDLSLCAPAAPLTPPTAGIVKNRKMEFEARSILQDEQDAELVRKNLKSKQVSVGNTEKISSDDDLSVKVLVDKYDSHSCKARCEFACEARSCRSATTKPAGEGSRRVPSAPFLRNSFCGVLRSGAGCERPPFAPNVVAMPPINYPNVVVASVVSKAQTKKQLQHGKTHPLTRLNNLTRSNNRANPVYNTM